MQSNIIRQCDIDAAGLGQIEVFRTHDGGDTWQGPAIVSPDQAQPKDPNDPLCGFTGPFQVAPAIEVGSKGEVYVIYQFGPFFAADGSNTPDSSIAFSRSLDGGVTWSPVELLVTINNMRDNPPVGYGKNRMNDQPRIAVARSGKHKGRIYVTFYQAVQPVSGPATAQSIVSSDIFILHSDDRGQTWSAPRGITAPVPPTGVKRFWPTATVRPGGDVDVVYLESHETQSTPAPADVECDLPIGGGLRRTGPLSSLVDTWWVQSRDGGLTFGQPVRVSEQTGNWCRAAYLFSGGLYSNFGDYLGVTSAGNRTFALWPDGRNDFSDIFFAKVKGKIHK